MKHLLKDANGSGSSTPFVDSSGNTVTFKSGVWDRIKDNMVLWYDLKRQGATNETMSANPKLIDLSGNGHDATCYNFAWSGMSSIGGYNQSPISGSSYKKTIAPVQYVKAWIRLYNKSTYNKNKSWTIKVTCDTKPFTEADDVFVFTRNITTDEIYHLSDNIVNNIPLTIPAYDGEILEDGVWLNLNRLINNNVTIEILPEYPNALVSDGVDDYAMVEGLSLLTDYTVIAKRKRLDIDLKRRGTLSSKFGTGKSAAFAFEYIEDNTGRQSVYSFGNNYIINHVDTDISYMTKDSYNGIYIKAGTEIDTDFLTLFSTRKNQGFASATLYSFILFNRTLTTKEINWVKENLIEGDTEL